MGLTMLNLYDELKLQEKANNICLYLSNKEAMTYKQLDERVAQFCNFFKRLHLKVGDRIIQQTDKSVDALCVYLAALCYGVIYIPLNPDFTFIETTYFIEDANPSLFICREENAKAILDYLTQEKRNCAVYTLCGNGQGSLQQRANQLSIQFIGESQHSQDIACILYTSGTTGKPKGAVLTHRNLLSNALDLMHIWQLTGKDTLLHMLPIFHCHGLFFACNTLLLSGGKMIFLPKFEVTTALQFLPESTLFMGVPTYYNRLLATESFNKELVKNIRIFISGSAPLSQKTFMAFSNKTGKNILERYGMTETGINASNPLQGERIPLSVGLPLPGVNIRIADDEDIDLGLNQIGHIQVRGDNVFSGYWQKESFRQDYFTKDNYFRTGDIGVIKENGYLSILDRSKDLIISGGLNIYPKEIEEALGQIEDVMESAVIGLPHADFGEQVVAIVVKKEESILSSEDIILQLKKVLAGYKVPKQVIFKATLPRNAMGKVQKNVLKDGLLKSIEP